MPPPPPPQPAPTAAAPREATLHAVDALASYSDTLAEFLDQWNSVILDVASIAATFAVLIPGPDSDPKTLPAAEPQPNPAPEPERDSKPHPKPELAPNAAPGPGPEPEPEPEPQHDPAPNAAPVLVLGEPEPEPEAQPDPVPAPAPNPERQRERKGGEPSAAELELRCKQMNCRGLRRFVTAHVRDHEPWLRNVGPDALRRAPDPAALVLRTVGRYYIRAESRDAEDACRLLLELYVRDGCPRRQGHGQGQREEELRQEAREGALSWRSRLLRFGDDEARGARGLAFFMAAFGVPTEFPAQELYDLVVVDAADAAACTAVLKCSKLFVKKMLDVAIEMINKAMYLQAIRIILAFELQDAFPLAATLSLMMEKLEHDRKDESEEQASERDEEELALLSSIFTCMEDHKLCPSEFSSFVEKIVLLEERVGKPNQASTGIKRKRTEDCVEQNAP